MAEKAVADMTPGEAKAELAKREVDKMTRRAALAKIGMRAGLGLFAAFSVDDLARLVAKKMEQQAGQNAAVDKVARDLHNAGVAFAVPPPQEDNCEYIDDNGNTYMALCSDKCKKPCEGFCKTLHDDMVKCGTITDPTEREACNSAAGKNLGPPKIPYSVSVRVKRLKQPEPALS